MGGYWYGPGEPACQLLLNNVTPLSHFHNTHKHARTHKHTLIPVANTNGWTLHIVMLWSSVNHDAACVSNVTRLAGKTVCVCACLCVCAQSQNDYHDIHESRIQYQAWSREGDKRCVSARIPCPGRIVIKCCNICGLQQTNAHLFIQFQGKHTPAHTHPVILLNIIIWLYLMNWCSYSEVVLRLSSFCAPYFTSNHFLLWE